MQGSADRRANDDACATVLEHRETARKLDAAAKKLAADHVVGLPYIDRVAHLATHRR